MKNWARDHDKRPTSDTIAHQGEELDSSSYSDNEGGSVKDIGEAVGEEPTLASRMVSRSNSRESLTR